MYHIFNARGCSVLSKHVACIDGSDKIWCGWPLYVY